MGYVSDPIERQAIIRDETWMDGQIVRHTIGLKSLSPNGFEDIVHTGLHGWDISPSTDDGMDSLKAATQLALKNPSTHAQSTRDVIREWEALRGTENDELAKQMLLPLYQEVGDKQSAEALQQ